MLISSKAPKITPQSVMFAINLRDPVALLGGCDNKLRGPDQDQAQTIYIKLVGAKFRRCDCASMPANREGPPIWGICTAQCMSRRAAEEYAKPCRYRFKETAKDVFQDGLASFDCDRYYSYSELITYPQNP